MWHCRESPLGLWHPSAEKRFQGGYPAPPELRDAPQMAHSALILQEAPGESLGFAHWESDTNRRRAEDTAISTHILADYIASYSGT